MPARRDETRPATRKELLSVIAGADDMRVNSLKRVLVCLERRPELQEALSTAVAEEWMRDIGAERFPKMDIAVAMVFKDLTDMAVDLERVLERET